MTRRRLMLVCCATAILTACNTAPKEIRTTVHGPNVVLVQEQPYEHVGAEIRWGGRLLEVHNKEDFTELTIASRRLDKSGRPIPGGYLESKSKYTGGRFVARIDGFLEPTDFEKGSNITFVGVIHDVEVRDVGDYPYAYPIVAVTDYFVWEPHLNRNVHPYYVPLMHPYYGLFPYGYGPYFFPGPVYAYPYYR